MILGGEIGGERGILSTKGLISLPLRCFLCSIYSFSLVTIQYSSS